jgi:hypothetical protein
MATPTYDLLESVTLASAASSVTFSSIDQSYGDLILTISSTGSGNTYVRFNSDSGSNYSSVSMAGDGSSTSSYAATEAFGRLSNASRNSTPSIYVGQIMDYSATDKHKSWLSRENISTFVAAIAGRWANTSAITQIELVSGTYNSGSVISLYGIAKTVV